MFGLDAFMLARIQFAFTVSFHIIFPAITIGLATYLAVLEGLWLKTRNPDYQKLYHSGRKFLRLTLGWALYLPCHGLSIRHQLEWFLRLRWFYHWPITDL